MIVHIPPGLSQFFYESYCTLIEYNVCMFFILSHGAFTLQRGASRAPHSSMYYIVIEELQQQQQTQADLFSRLFSCPTALLPRSSTLYTTCRHLWNSDHRFLLVPKRHEDMSQEAPKGVCAKTSPSCCSAA